MTVPAPYGNSNYPTRYRVGAGRSRELARECLDLGIHRPLVVTDRHLATLPWLQELCAALHREGLTVGRFSAIDGNPDEATVTQGVLAFHDGSHDGVIAIGGGSPMDVGKCVALLAHQSGSLFDYEDIGDNWRRVDPSKVPPILALPTTAGTGSEVGRAGVIVDRRTGHKRIVFHPKMLPSVVLADPELTLELPPRLTAATGMDALAHCFEALCAPTYHPFADGVALEGLRLVAENLPLAYRDGHDLVARTHMMVAAAMGATAFQKGLGLVHALSHPLGGRTGIHHGTANAIFLPYVMVYNRAAIALPMRRLANTLGHGPGGGFDSVIQWLLDLRAEVDMPHTLSDAITFDEAMAASLAPMAIEDPSLGGNPVPANVADCEAVFLRAWRGDLTPPR